MIRYLLVEEVLGEIRVQAAFHLEMKYYMAEAAHLPEDVFLMEKIADLGTVPY
jgi:hypothetical protein